MTKEAEALILFDELFSFNKNLLETEKFVIFEALRKDFEEKQLLDEINKEDGKGE